MLNVSLTTDFECFSPSMAGDININIEKQMTEPAKFLSDLAKKYDAKISFFLEIIQWERFHHIPDLFKHVKDLDLLIKHLLDEGHDIQIHSHSEWVTSTYNSRKWFRKWEGPDSAHEILDQFFELFDIAMDRLISLLPNSYEAICYRAGAYKIDPVEVLFPPLSKRGLIADSSRHNRYPFEAFKEKQMISLPILGDFPTQISRWDMNLSPTTPFEIFRSRTGIIESRKIEFAVMMGHTKMIHQTPALERLLSMLRDDDEITVMKISDQAKIAQKLLNKPSKL